MSMTLRNWGIRATAAVGAAAVATVPFGQTAAAPAPAPPASKAAWAVDYGAQRCALIRTGAGPEPVTFAVRIIPGHDDPEVLLSKANWHHSGIVKSGRLEVVLKPGGDSFEAKAPVVVAAGAAGHVVQMDLASGFLEALARANAMEVRRAAETYAELPLPGAGKAVKALHDCNDALVTAWGIDLKAAERLKSRPVAAGNPQGWLNQSDYPESALRRNSTGTVVARLDVDAGGQVAACTVVAGSGDRELDEQTCTSLRRRGRYRPAIDLEGRAAPDRVLTTVVWSIQTIRQPGGG